MEKITNENWITIAKMQLKEIDVTVFTDMQIAVVAQCLKNYSDSLKKRELNTDKDLFGEKVKNVMFKGVAVKDDNGFMMCACGKSAIDNQHYVVTTNHLHIDEIPNECNDASNFSELVAKLLNEHFNK